MIWVTTRSSWCEENFVKRVSEKICIILLLPRVPWALREIQSQPSGDKAEGVILWKVSMVEEKKRRVREKMVLGILNIFWCHWVLFGQFLHSENCSVILRMGIFHSSFFASGKNDSVWIFSGNLAWYSFLVGSRKVWWGRKIFLLPS